jgi:hypothetical protein
MRPKSKVDLLSVRPLSRDQVRPHSAQQAPEVPVPGEPSRPQGMLERRVVGRLVLDACRLGVARQRWST